MPGLISPSSAASFETVAGMKRSRTEDAPAPGAVPIPKKRRVTHSLRHTQPVQHVVEPIGGGFGADGDKQFFDHQLQRAIAIQLKTAGFDGAKADVLEYMRGMVEDCMAYLPCDEHTIQ
jgi:transcription initiation factor TFIID subunit 8